MKLMLLSLLNNRLIAWPWEICFVPLWIVLCISLVGVLYTIIFAGILLRMPEVNAEQRRTSTNSALGYSFLVIPLLVFLVLLTNKLDGSIRISFFSAFAPLFLTFFTLVITSFGSRGGQSVSQSGGCIQSDPSGCKLSFVGVKTKVPSHYILLIL